MKQNASWERVLNVIFDCQVRNRRSVTCAESASGWRRSWGATCWATRTHNTCVPTVRKLCEPRVNSRWVHHLLGHQVPQHVCPYCKKAVRTLSQLKVSATPAQHVCPYCKKAVWTPSQLKVSATPAQHVDLVRLSSRTSFELQFEFQKIASTKISCIQLIGNIQ